MPRICRSTTAFTSTTTNTLLLTLLLYFLLVEVLLQASRFSKHLKFALLGSCGSAAAGKPFQQMFDCLNVGVPQV